MRKNLKITVLSLSLLTILATSTVSPALGEIKKALSTEDPFTLKMILTLPAIVLIPFSLLSGKISLVMKKRKIVIFGLVVYMIGGLGGGFTTTLHQLLFFRIILGIGLGLLIPLSTSLIADFFLGKERTLMMGYSNATANLGSIAATLSSGWLATINWRLVFGVYGISFFVLILVLFSLEEPPSRHVQSGTPTITGDVLLLAFLGLCLNIVFYAFVTNIALFIENNHIGSSSTAGIVMSSLTLAGFLSGLFLQRLSYLLKSYGVPISLAMMAIGFSIMAANKILSYILLSAFLIGFGLGALKPILLLKVTEVIPRLSNAFAISIVSSALFLGKFISPFFLDALAEAFGNNTIEFIFMLVSLLLGLACASSLLLIVIKYPLFHEKYNS